MTTRKQSRRDNRTTKKPSGRTALTAIQKAIRQIVAPVYTNEQKRQNATKLLTQHPEWSDAAIASIIHTATSFVGKVRKELESSRKSTVKKSSGAIRVGLDGRVRRRASRHG